MTDPAFPYGKDGIVRAIAAFLDAAGVERTAIVGHSWGGGFVLRLAQLYPDRVSRLALLAPAGVDVKDAWEFRLVRTPLLGERAMRLLSKRPMRHMLRKSFTHPGRIPEGLIDQTVRAIRSQPNRAARMRAMLKAERSVNWADTERDLQHVTVPVLLLWGGEGRYLPASALQRFTSRLPNAVTHVLEGCGHSLHDDCPEQTYPLLLPFLAAADD